MKSNLLKVVPPFSNEACAADAKATLERAASEGFTTVIIHGFKDGKIRTITSRSANSMLLLGALEAAKVEIWQR